eukprot:TRINITY_DN4267_c0_g2_i1.p1 TRINITY_DN4267_c0_g2~~TRINITY_DN4267_c0_g2_i1.p1  ORF type:complete len:572 (+),score=124.22 TRINITY_DN4267_c0_g2_i1:203-1918(+)
MLMEDVDTKKERLQRAFVNLDEQREVLAKCTIQWKELEEHFNSLELNIKKRMEDLEEKEKAFEAKTNEVQNVLDNREQSIASKEKALLARVQEQKDAALALIAEERRKLDSSSSANGDQKDLSNGQCKKEEEDGVMKGNQVRTQLKILCETMDSKGLLEYLVEHKKDAAGLRADLPSALNSAVDPSRLVLDCLEGIYSPEQPTSGDKKESGVPARRHACILLLESLPTVLADPIMGEEHPVVSSAMKEHAKSIALEWKSKINAEDHAPSGGALEVWAFLQLLGTFGITSNFDKDELCKFVLAVARRSQTPELCCSLGLSSKIPELVKTLVESSKQIEAVNFACGFELTDKFPPVPLLKEFLKDAKKASQAILKNGNNSTAAQNEANTKELSAYRAVIRSIEKHRLESQYPPEPLQKRVAQLEKAKADRKRSAGAVKSQPKRPRANGANASAHASQLSAVERNPSLYTSANVSADRSFLRALDRFQYSGAASAISSYNLQGQNAYERSYGSTTYGASNRSPVSLPRPYVYANENRGSSLLGNGSYNSSTTYGNHHFSKTLTHPPSAYPPYIH